MYLRFSARPAEIGDATKFMQMSSATTNESPDSGLPPDTVKIPRWRPLANVVCVNGALSLKLYISKLTVNEQAGDSS